MTATGARRGVALLGSTGSIGRSTLDVLRRQQEHFRLVALTAGQNREKLEAQVSEWRPSYAALAGVTSDSRWPTGPEVLIEAATHPDADIVVNAVVGAVGLEATLAALQAVTRVVALEERLLRVRSRVEDEGRYLFVAGLRVELRPQPPGDPRGARECHLTDGHIGAPA